MKTLRSRLTIVLLILPPCVSATASPGNDRALPKPEDVSELLEPVRLKHGLPALGGAVVDGDRVIAVGAAGFRKAKGSQRVTTADLWHLGSCGKAMTTTLIARLVEKRKLS